MKILVTGGVGFNGSHTVDALFAKDYEVRIRDSLTLPVHADGNLPSYVPADAEFTPGDVRDRNAWERALGWKPTKDLSAIAKEYVEWARTQTEPRDHFAEAESHMKAVGALRTVMG